MKKRALAISTLVAVGAAAAPAAAADDLLTTAKDAGSFTTLVSLVEQAGLDGALTGKDDLTVLAPTDAAFAKVPQSTLDALAADPAKLREVLTYHVLAGDAPASTVVTLKAAKTLSGQGIKIRVRGGKVKINDSATVVTTDIDASNGTIHVIDEVLIPKRLPRTSDNLVSVATKAGSFSTLTSLLKTAGLVDALSGKGKLTVFAPTDEAFAKVPAETLAALQADPAALRDVLLYHVVKGDRPASKVVKLKAARTLDGRGVKVRGTTLNDSATIVATDVEASNGTIHVIDEVLLPPTLPPVTANLAEVAIGAGEFTTLVSLVQQAGLVGALTGDDPLTVFAPTDEAFAKVPPATLAAVAADPALLARVLTYHVVEGERRSGHVAQLRAVKTLSGDGLKIRATKDGITLNDSTSIVSANARASNGVIHVIDEVLLPPGL